MRTSKGHLVYNIPPARSQLRSRKPILRHACYNHTRSIHVYYEHQVSFQFSTKCTTSLITLTECTQRSQVCDPTLHQTCGSKVGLSTDKFNKWLREALSKTSPPRGDSRLTGTILAWSWSESSFVELQVETPSGSVGSS